MAKNRTIASQKATENIFDWYDIPRKNHLFLVGIDNYVHCNKLRTAVSDTKAFRDMLLANYDFEADRIYELYNDEATRKNIHSQLRDLMRQLTDEDNLIVYFAGHGSYEEHLDLGYWIPVEAHYAHSDEFISNDELSRFFRNIKTHHLLVLSDSCFSGSLFSGSREASYNNRKDSMPSRWAFCSGMKEVVVDDAGGMSPFAKYLIHGLKYSDGDLRASALVEKVAADVAEEADQTPNGGPIRSWGDEQGQFIFRLKKNEGKDWQFVKENSSPAIIEQFLRKYPDGVYHSDAQALLAGFEDEQAWEQAKNLHTEFAYDDYLDDFPQGRYAGDARKVIAEITVNKAWEHAKQKNTVASYRAFESSYPSSIYAKEARMRRQELKKAQSTPEYPEHEEVKKQKPLPKLQEKPAEENTPTFSESSEPKKKQQEDRKRSDPPKKAGGGNSKVVKIVSGMMLLLLSIWGVSKIDWGKEESEKKAYFALVSRADSLMNEQQYNKADSLYNEAGKSPHKEKSLNSKQKAVRDKLNYEMLKAKADQLFLDKKYDKAEKEYEKLLRLQPKEAYAKNQIAKIQEARKVTYEVNGVRFTMVYVEGGSFTMGCTPEQGDDCHSNEKPAHPVSLGSFQIGETEVTQELWRAVMGDNPSYFKSCAKCPVERIYWEKMEEFIKVLSKKTGKSFRLPTEAEWEYAARGGNKSKGYKYSGSNNVDEVAWYYPGSGIGLKTHPVAQKKPNELGLYDMSGNIHECCQDDWHDSYSGAPSNGTAWIDSPRASKRVYRGGSISYNSGYARVSSRLHPSGYYGYELGLRLAASVP